MNTNASHLRLLALVTAILASPANPTAFGQTEAATPPVGFITVAVQGGGTIASPKLSLISPTLMQPVSWQGLVTAVSSAGNSTTITVDGVQWTTGQYNGANGSFYVEVISTATPANSGVLSDITSSTALASTSTIATGDNLSGKIAVGDSIRIRKDVTISDLFGAANSAGLLASDEPSSADEVLVYDGANSTSYFYYNGGGGFPDGWYNSTFNPATPVGNTTVISPHQGVVVKRKSASALSFPASGAVKTGNTLLPVVNGLNVLGTVSAKGVTLDTSGLFTGNAATGVKPSDEPATADEVILYTAGGQTSYFYYNGGGGFPDGWYNSTFSPASPVGSTVTIAPGTSFVINRKGGVAFNWPLPSPTSF